MQITLRQIRSYTFACGAGSDFGRLTVGMIAKWLSTFLSSK